MSSNHLTITFLNELPHEYEKSHTNCENRIAPFADSEIYFAPIESAEKLVNDDDVKTVYKLSLYTKDINYNFFPGDTIGVLPCNDEVIVNKLLSRLNIEPIADKPCKLHILEQTRKQNSRIPKHLPDQCTIRNIFLKHVDIQSPPKKVFLKALTKFINNPTELTKLNQICSTKTNKEYIDLVTGSGRTLLSLLNTFPSCQPPVEIILQHLTPLQPRPYSISCSPLTNNLEITFNVIVHDDYSKGVCTSWLEQLIERNNSHDLVPFYFRQPNNFRLPEESSVPLILIATGTGIAPFRGFLQHKLLTELGGQVWLFYGCRYSNKDYLYKNEIEDCLKHGIITQLDVAFSRDQNEKKYVQHNIELHGAEFTDWLLQKDAKVFVCGDAKTMIKEVQFCVINMLAKHGHMTYSESESFFREMQNKGKFVVDVWA